MRRRRRVVRPPSVTRILEELRGDVWDARLHFDIYRIYKHPSSRAKYWPAIITYENFFSTSLRAQFVAMVAALGRVFDNDPRNISMATLFNADPSFERVGSAKLANARDLWKRKAKSLRHQIVAHHAANTSAKEAFKRASVTLDDIDDLISACEGLVEVWTRRAGCHVHLASGTKGDTLALLDALCSNP